VPAGRAVLADGVVPYTTVFRSGGRGVGHAQAVGRDGDRAVAAVGLADDGQAGVERRAQVVGVGVVDQDADGVGRAVLDDGLGVVDRVGRVVDGGEGDAAGRRFGVHLA